MIVEALAAAVGSRSEWDEAPALGFVYVENGACRVSELPLPEAIWSTDRPPAVLARLAEGFGEWDDLLQDVAPEGLYGAAFRCEAWEISGGKPGTAERSEAMADSAAHRLHVRPDRKEIRSIYAVDRAGITYSAVQRRGESNVRKSIAYPEPGKHGFSGTIPGALDLIVASLLGVSLPSRKG